MFTKLRALALKHFETTLILIILLGVFAIALMVHYKFAFLNFFFLPVILAGYHLGKRQAVLTASLCVLLVVLYHVFFRVLLHLLPPISLDEILNIVTWAGFLILTAAIIGVIAEQREARMKNLQRAYTGVLEILLKYLEVADERKPHSVRVAQLAGKIAEAAGLSTFQVENIKSAALLIEAGDLRSSLHLYEEVATFIASESGPPGKTADDRERVLLMTTASLLKEVEPILANYFYHYIEEADIIDKDLSTVPVGSGIIALADLHDRLNTNMLTPPWKDRIRSLHDIRSLSGRSFQATVVQALFKVISPPE
ncbi:MAG: hypothetical protein JXE07_00255 [Candidatus Aminicenantes bacterium]|nr:hypothetical protein [Candidatus Aminicenantes bacterium]